MEMYKKILLAFALIGISHAHAVVINDYDWVKLSDTAGLSYAQVTTTYNDYHLASEEEFDVMFAGYVNPSDSYFVDVLGISNIESSSGFSQIKVNFTSAVLDNKFFSDFGIGNVNYGPSYTEYYSTGYYLDGSTLRSGGVFVRDTVGGTDVGFEYHDFDYSYYNYLLQDPNKSTPSYGWFLVADTPITVTEPSILILIAVGLTCLGFSRYLIPRELN